MCVLYRRAFLQQGQQKGKCDKPKTRTKTKSNEEKKNDSAHRHDHHRITASLSAFEKKQQQQHCLTCFFCQNIPVYTYNVRVILYGHTKSLKHTGPAH